MNIGELSDRISILNLNQDADTYSWETATGIWAKVERMDGNNLFSRVGLGTKSIKLTIRKNSSLTLHNAFRWQEKHLFLTDIIDIDRMYYEVSAALIEPKLCSVEREGEPKRNELNRPVYEGKKTIIFPGCLTEKYLGHSQGEPMATIETRYVLVTPKVIELNINELVTIGNATYTVLTPHTLDEYKNEYEIMFKGDV